MHALEDFNRSSQLAPREAEPHYYRARVLECIGNVDEAIEAYSDSMCTPKGSSKYCLVSMILRTPNSNIDPHTGGPICLSAITKRYVS